MTEDEAEVGLRLLDLDLPVPAHAHPGHAGADLHSAEDEVFAPGHAANGADRGRACAAPRLRWLRAPALWLAHRHGLTVVNAPGTVDAGYRGEVVREPAEHRRRTCP